MTIRTIEPRTATSSPLVERPANFDADHQFDIPAGRRLAPSPRTDGLSSQGLTNNEIVAFDVACNQLRRAAGLKSQPDSDFQTAEEIAAVATGGVKAEDVDAFITERRKTYPLVSSFADLPPGDPSSNFEEVPDIAPEPTVISALDAPSAAKAISDAAPEIQELVVAGVAGSTAAAGVGGSVSTSGVTTTPAQVTHVMIPVADHVEAKSLLKKIEAEGSKLGDDAVHVFHAFTAKLRELLHLHG